MSIISREDLLKEEKEEQREYTTPASLIIKDLFSSELSSAKWRKYSLEQMKALIDEKAEALGIDKKDKFLILLRRAVGRCKTREDVLMKMSNFLIGEAQ